jgi:uncharacterized protein (TIGR00369 family)
MKERRKIRNPFKPEDYMCFGCSPGNHVGLKLTFEEDDEKLYASWQPDPVFQGYLNVLHGGIIATLLDEAGAWCVYVKAGTSGVTASLTVRYLKPVYISKGKVSVEARLVTKGEKNALLSASLFDGEGKLCAEADLDYFIYPEQIARRRFYYPGTEAFRFQSGPQAPQSDQ